MSDRAVRARVARETVEILERGWYTAPGGARVSIRDELERARTGSVLYTPARLEAIRERLEQLLRERAERPPAVIEVANETALAATRRLVQNGERALALNFASARNPGGGFLKGSQAQEESLARASGLYACINLHQEMYRANRAHPSCLYTDHMIYGPDVPVFRDDGDVLLDEPYPVSFLTAPAVNAGAVRANEPHNVARMERAMRARIDKLLSVALLHEHETVVLGAWGCGVFQNDPAAVAGWFADALTGQGTFRTAFRKVLFAVLDRTPGRTVIRPFERSFPHPGGRG